MRTYQAEKDASIDFGMNKAGGSSSFVVAKVRIDDIKKYFDGMSVSDLAKTTSTVQTVEELLGNKQPDLALVVAILVSTGWNLNDDVFTPEEVWKARLSPLHKPINDNHQADKILGHIVQTRTLDKSGNVVGLSDDGVPPDEFDIEVAGVLYKEFPELSDRIDEIISKAKTGEMFVSMEAWFPDFGYGLIDSSTGEIRLVERTEDTAFLTKHLRIYGGSGKYQGNRLGRVLKDIIFGAQGFVDDPANPESVIKVAANEVVVSHGFVTAELSELSEGGVEDVNEKEMKELQTKLEEAQASLESRTKEVTELQKEVEEFKSKDYDGQIVALTKKIDELNSSATESSEKVVAVETAKVELQKQLDEVTKRADDCKAELDGIRKNETARDRLMKLLVVKKVEDEKATLAELREMTDETFEVVLKYAGEIKDKGTVDGDQKSDADTTDNDSSSKTKQEKEAEQAEAALKNVKEEDSADMKVSEDTAKTDADRWASMATKMCGRKDEKDEGGE